MNRSCGWSSRSPRLVSTFSSVTFSLTCSLGYLSSGRGVRLESALVRTSARFSQCLIVLKSDSIWDPLKITLNKLFGQFINLLRPQAFLDQASQARVSSPRLLSRILIVLLLIRVRDVGVLSLMYFICVKTLDVDELSNGLAASKPASPSFHSSHLVRMSPPNTHRITDLCSVESARCICICSNMQKVVLLYLRVVNASWYYTKPESENYKYVRV